MSAVPGLVIITGRLVRAATLSNRAVSCCNITAAECVSSPATERRVPARTHQPQSLRCLLGRFRATRWATATAVSEEMLGSWTRRRQSFIATARAHGLGALLLCWRASIQSGQGTVMVPEATITAPAFRLTLPVPLPVAPSNNPVPPTIVCAISRKPAELP